MAHVVIMPKQGQSVESCIVSEFKVKVGDAVKAGDILFGYETDKATFEEEAPVDGTVLAVFWKDGDEIPCLENVLVIGSPGESFEEFAPKGASAPASEVIPSETASASLRPLPQPLSGSAGPSLLSGRKSPEVSEGITSFGSAEAPVSPRARRMAAEKGVDVTRIAGSGPYGRVIERDVEAAAQAQGRLTGLAKARMAEGGWRSPGTGSGLAGAVRGEDLRSAAEFEVVKLSNMRKLIARSMFSSLQNSAQLTHMLGADASRLQALRKQAKKALEEGRVDVNITVNDLVCYAVVRALKKFPAVNSHCLGDAMRLFRCVNLGLAVDTERGLMVPAVPHADELDIAGLSRALKKVADDSRKGSVNPDLLSPEAASFTVSNLGGFGVEWFTPIINVPQSAILGVGTIVPRPRMQEDGSYAVVPYLGLSLTYDHRAIDGGEATRFLREVATEIEKLDLVF